MPDLNTVPASPHVLAATTSRRASAQQMPPPPVPNSPSLNILPSNQSAVNQTTASPPSLPSPNFASSFPQGPVLADAATSSSAPLPMRHPRPLTAADLHLQLEKENEAVVRGSALLATISPWFARHLINTTGQPSHTRALPPSCRPERVGGIQRLLHVCQRIRHRINPRP